MMTGVLGAILSVFTGVAEWISEAVTALVPMFYVESTGLTFLGCLAVAGLAISVAFLIIGVWSFTNSPYLSFRFADGVLFEKESANEETLTLSHYVNNGLGVGNLVRGI